MTISFSSFFLLALSTSLLNVSSSLKNAPSFSLSLSQHEDCDLWASRDGECVNNPSFMWSSCHASCVGHAEDTQPRCSEWAAEGECVNNPHYLHIQCPDSCGAAVAWSPWVRRELGIAPLPEVPRRLGEDSNPVPHNLWEAAELMKGRVVKYVGGLHSVVEGLTSTAPTEFLGMLGLAEAVMYTARLQELVMQFAEIKEHIDDHRSFIADVVATIKLGYQPDFIYRSMPTWVSHIETSSNNINSFLRTNGNKQNVEQLTNRMGQVEGWDLSFERFADQFTTVQVDYNVDKNKINTEAHFVRLNNGVDMPKVGFGTWQLEGADCVEAVLAAIRNGYTFFDSAQAYRNEHDLGRAISQAIRSGLVTRKQLFIATKISDEGDAGYGGVKKLVQKQLRELQTDYIDLYMLHSPISDKKLQRTTWAGLEELYDAGVIKALGVSNFDVRELEDLLSIARIKPTVVQNKLDIYHVGKQMDSQGINNVQFCLEHDMVLLSYSPFSAYPFMMQPADDPVVRYLVDRRASQGEHVTAGQMILKWIAQRGLSMIPRSSNPARQKENIDALKIRTLDRTEMTLLDLCQLLVGNPYAFAISMPTIGIY